MSDLRSVVDQMGREVTFVSAPKRVLSIVPSQTEFLIELGADVVGRTKFCIHPINEIKSVPIVGGTKNLRLEAIRELGPDLIIGNKEENNESDIRNLENEFPVWMSDIYSLEDSFDMMRTLGEILDLTDNAEKIIQDCKSSLSLVKGSCSGKVVYLIWQKPWMAAGRNTFIDHMLDYLGYENVIKEERYPELSTADIEALNPDYILFSSEPFPFKKQHLSEAESLWTKAKCQMVDGELFSWYGSRLKHWS